MTASGSVGVRVNEIAEHEANSSGGGMRGGAMESGSDALTGVNFPAEPRVGKLVTDEPTLDAGVAGSVTDLESTLGPAAGFSTANDEPRFRFRARARRHRLLGSGVALINQLEVHQA